MEHNMILSASGWRKVFASSGNEQDTTTDIGEENTLLCALIGESFAQYMTARTGKKNPTVAVGIDTRPTGKAIADAVLRVLCHYGFKVRYLGVASAPEIMAYSRSMDGFCYISASHNPVGHNGLKFGMNDGGVIPGSEAKKLSDDFKQRISVDNAEQHAREITSSKQVEKALEKVYKAQEKYKAEAVSAYRDFIVRVITGCDKAKEQASVFSVIKNSVMNKPLSIVVDMNGSSRTLSIDKNFIPEFGLGFIPFNDEPGNIVHEIIPEPENLVHCAQKIQQLQAEGNTQATLGYMPDCDGDRGNIVYWNEKTGTAEPIPAQEVFALCVMAETAYEIWKDEYVGSSGLKLPFLKKKIGVAVNCPTSMRIEEICSVFGAEVFRVEVGEANVVNLAREKRKAHYTVRILGEGSNGGNITYPSAVRDPVASVFAIIKLLAIRDTISPDGKMHKGLFHLWCEKSGQEEKYTKDFTLQDIIATLPSYTTTGVSESRAVLHVKSEDKGLLKARFQQIFEEEFKQKKSELLEKYGIKDYIGITTNGTSETKNPKDWNNQNGGLKVLFTGENKAPVAFIWMRPSGTEPVFRVMCDVKGNNLQAERELLAWETELIQKADL